MAGSIRRPRLLVAAAIIVVALALGGSARALVNGVPDGNGHPYVGSMIGTADGVQVPFCTVTLLAPQVALTAGHCVVNSVGLGLAGNGFWVSFDNPLTWNAAGQVSDPIRVASAVVNPSADTKTGHDDWAVLLLAQPVIGITSAHLAPVGALDAASVQARSTLTVVGRGMEVIPIFCYQVPGYQTCAGRNDGTFEFQSASTWDVHFSGDPIAPHNFGFVPGDSGSPVFLDGGDPNGVVATGEMLTGENDANSRANRVDTVDAHAFIDPFLH